MPGMRRLSTLASVGAILAAVATGRAAPVAVCATTPALGALVAEIGATDVALTVFARPGEDPRLVDPRSALARALADADLLVVNGRGLEAGWLPRLQQAAGNARVLAGGPGYLDASAALTVPAAHAGRARHAEGAAGEAYYLLDPVRGVAAARAIRNALGALRPDRIGAFRARWTALRNRVSIALVGRALAERHDGLKLAELAAAGRLDRFLDRHGEADALGGWLRALAPYRGARLAADRPVWSAFARRFGLEIVAVLEPGGAAPPPLDEVVETLRRERVGVVLVSADADPRRAAAVADRTGARVLAMAEQVGARPGASDYVSTIGFDVRQVAAGLAHARR